MSFLSRLSLGNRSIVVLASIAVILFGIFVIPLLKQELLPPVTYPSISIITSYPGADPTQVEQDVTNPLEQNIQALQNIQQTTSQSSAGLSLITVVFNVGMNLDTAQQQLAIQVNKTQPGLPANVTPQLEAFNVNDIPIITLTVTSSQDPQNLGVALTKIAVPALQGISGVGAVNVTGIQQQIVAVTLDQKKLQADNVSTTQVQNALQANNIAIPAGEVNANGQTFAVRVGHTFNSLQSLKDLVIVAQSKSQSAGSSLAPVPIKLSDVATVRESLTPSSTLTRVNGKPSLGIAITEAANGNTVSISDAVNAQIPILEKELGSDVQIAIISNQAPAIQTSIADLTREGLLGAGFAILVILLFLLSVRSTIVTAISIPLSIIIALIALWTQNYSLNIMTLSGLTIAVGRVIDDSIVVLENIYRHLRNGEEKQRAVLSGVKEVATAVTASTFTTVAVFLPLAFVGGIVGEYTHPLAFTVTIALLASLLAALTIVPVFAYWFLKAPQRVNGAPQIQRSSILERIYTPLIRWVTRHRVITVSLAFLLLIGSFALFPLLPSNAFGSQGGNSFTFTQQLPPNTSLSQTDLEAQQVERLLETIHDIQTYQVTIGTSNVGSSASTGTNVASFLILLKPGKDSAVVQQMVSNGLSKLTNSGTITFQNQLNNTVDVTVQAPDSQTLRQATQQVFTVVKQAPNTVNATNDLANEVPFINVQVDPAKAAKYGLTTLQVAQVLQTVYTGIPVTTVVITGERQPVNLTIATQTFTIQQMQDIRIPNPPGAVVQLRDVADITQVSGPVQVSHVNGKESATITLTATGQNVGGVTQDVQNRLIKQRLPNGATATLGGNAAGSQDALSQLYLALLFAIPVVFMVMVVTFRSLIQPLILLVSIPFAAMGAIVLAVITQTAIGISSLFGFLMLIGIVVTNAIVLIDRINHFRAQGMDARAAVIAGGQQRVRPILMTAVATITALIPMAIGGGGNAIVSGGLAIVVIGGLTSSTFLTLLFVPTLYVIVESSRDRFRKKQRDPVAEWPTDSLLETVSPTDA